MLNFDDVLDAQNLHAQIIDAFRAELQEYGGLLNLFTQQQDAILNRKPEAVTEVGHIIERQLTTLQARRSHRENLILEMTPHAKAPLTLLQTILLFPEPMRPLVEALAIEMNRLIGRVRRRAQQNQMLLARTIELTQALSEKLKLSAVTRTRAQTGQRKIRPRRGRPARGR